MRQALAPLASLPPNGSRMNFAKVKLRSRQSEGSADLSCPFDADCAGCFGLGWAMIRAELIGEPAARMWAFGAALLIRRFWHYNVIRTVGWGSACAASMMLAIVSRGLPSQFCGKF